MVIGSEGAVRGLLLWAEPHQTLALREGPQLWRVSTRRDTEVFLRPVARTETALVFRDGQASNSGFGVVREADAVDILPAFSRISTPPGRALVDRAAWLERIGRDARSGGGGGLRRPRPDALPALRASDIFEIGMHE